MSSTPGASTPGQTDRTTETVQGSVDTSATGTTRLGSVVGDEVEVHEVRVVTDDTAFDFNVTNEGDDLFSAEQSPDASPESFVPDQNQHVGADGAVLAVDVSTAGTDADAHVAVSVSHVPPS